MFAFQEFLVFGVVFSWLVISYTQAQALPNPFDEPKEPSGTDAEAVLKAILGWLKLPKWPYPAG